MGGIKRRKMLKRLLARQKAFDAHGAFPVNNPGKTVPPMEMHRPGGKR